MGKISTDHILNLVKAQKDVKKNGQVSPTHGWHNLTSPRSVFLKLTRPLKTIQSKSQPHIFRGVVGPVELQTDLQTHMKNKDLARAKKIEEEGTDKTIQEIE